MGIGSRPVRGAWIETGFTLAVNSWLTGRVPYGARGLKHTTAIRQRKNAKSRPVRGAWIETQNYLSKSR